MEDIKIYINEHRGEVKIDAGVLRSTLNYDTYSSPHRHPVGNLAHVNEYTGHLDQTIMLPLLAAHVAVFLPTIGSIVLRIDGTDYPVAVGSIFYLSVHSGQQIAVKAQSPQDAYFIFHHFVFVGDNISFCEKRNYVMPLTEASNRNRLIPISAEQNAVFNMYLGAFSGRTYFILPLDSCYQNLFVITLEGNFEVQERLLFQGDGLSLPACKEIEVECLSTYGILLVAHF